MESSQVFGNVEECNSSESGWTTYICSPITKDDEDDEVDIRDDLTDDGDRNDDDGVHDHVKHHDEEDEHESDDSMASDASSGRRNSWGNGKDGVKHRSKKKAKYPAEKNGTKQEKEEGSVFTAKGASHVEVPSSEEEKVIRNNTWFGKRK